MDVVTADEDTVDVLKQAAAVRTALVCLYYRC